MGPGDVKRLPAEKTYLVFGRMWQL